MSIQKKPTSSLRPIGARALKSASDTLRPYFAGSRVADLYAGSGRFGLMALEEGAKEVIFVEGDKPRAAALKKETSRYGNAARVESRDVFTFLKEAEEPFEIVFADPPFEQWSQEFLVELAAAVSNQLTMGSIFLVKNPSRMLPSAPPPGLTPWKHAKFGESTLTYYRFGAKGDD